MIITVNAFLLLSFLKNAFSQSRHVCEVCRKKINVNLCYKDILSHPTNAMGHCCRPWGDVRIDYLEPLESYILLARSHLGNTYRAKEDNFS